MPNNGSLDHVFPGQTAVKWICLVLPSLVMAMAGAVKFLPQAQMGDQMKKMGLDPAVLPTLGILILGSLLLFWIPKTALFGAVLLTGYLGGVIATNWLFAKESPVIAIVLIVLFWVGYGLRFPRVMAAAGLAPAPESVRA